MVYLKTAITFDLSKFPVTIYTGIGPARLELARLTPADFKSAMSTIPSWSLIVPTGIEPVFAP